MSGSQSVTSPRQDLWGWRDQQLPDSTVILSSPSGKSYVTTPGTATELNRPDDDPLPF